MAEAVDYQDGKYLDIVAGANQTFGEVVTIGSLTGVCKNTVLSGEKNVLQVEGVFKMAKTAPLVISNGDVCYWDATNSKVTNVDAGQVNVYGVTVGGTTDGTYILEIDGETITYTAATAGSAAGIRDGLIALINSNYALRDTVKAAIKDADELYVYGLVAGDELSVADDNDTGTGDDLTVAEITEEAASLAKLGFAVADAASADTEVLVKLTPAIGAD
jgi:predicted RecA/RadA family phage recombinase